MTEPPRIGPVVAAPDADTIAAIEQLLALARDGKVHGFAYIGLADDRKKHFGLVGGEWVSDYLMIAGLLHWLANEAIKRWDDAAP